MTTNMVMIVMQSMMHVFLVLIQMASYTCFRRCRRRGGKEVVQRPVIQEASGQAAILGLVVVIDRCSSF